MEYLVLGPLRVVPPDGRPVRLRSAAQRRLLSLLVMRAGTVVSADELSDRLGLTAGALRTAMSRLRRVVGAGQLATVAPGYLLQAEQVDAARFDALVALARSTDDAMAAVAHYEAALRLWRGDAYAEFAGEDWAMGEARRLAERRADATEELAALLVDLQEWAIAIDRVEPLIEVEPFRERPRALLMRALAGSGRHIDALRAFQAYRQHLLAEVGTEPSATLVELDRRIASEPPGPELTTAGTVALLLTELLGESGPGSAPAQHYEVLDEVITGAGGVRPLYQGAGESAIGAFSRPAAAIGAAVTAQRRLAAELPGLSVRMAVHVDGVHRRGHRGYVGGAVPHGMRLRACGHGGQILVSETGAAAVGGDLPDGVTLVDLGPTRLDGDDRTERVWQVVHPDLRSTFPALGSASA